MRCIRTQRRVAPNASGGWTYQRNACSPKSTYPKPPARADCYPLFCHLKAATQRRHLFQWASKETKTPKVKAREGHCLVKGSQSGQVQAVSSAWRKHRHELLKHSSTRTKDLQKDRSSSQKLVLGSLAQRYMPVVGESGNSWGRQLIRQGTWQHWKKRHAVLLRQHVSQRVIKAVAVDASYKTRMLSHIVGGSDKSCRSLLIFMCSLAVARFDWWLYLKTLLTFSQGLVQQAGRSC
jgi:hypothetical protein